MRLAATIRSLGIEWAALPQSSSVWDTSLSFRCTPESELRRAVVRLGSKYLPGKTIIWSAILGISVFTDFLYVPLALVLYEVLKKANRNAMLLATAFIGLYVTLDLAVT
jgi:hypothetical protein